MKGKDDDRFKHVTTDPRFRSIPRNERKVKIDKRFEDMFTKKKFKLKYAMDKRGRPIHHTTSEDLRKYYELSSSDSDSGVEESGEGVKPQSSTTRTKKKSQQKLPKKAKEPSPEVETEGSAYTESSDSSEDDDDLKQPEVDLARGEGNIETSSSEEESEESEAEEESDHWGELDKEAPRTNDITSRLAVCNMDWDKVKAQDLFIILNSFKPPEGVIKSVKIYLSEFGRKRLEEERVKGPVELAEAKIDDNGHETAEGSNFKSEIFRKYELNRLKYYYAVAECDSPETANTLYEELDGREYESSATSMDLRFIPDDMTFDEEPCSSADSLPDPSSYTPLLFTNTALQSAKVQLTWDETDQRRTQAFQKAFTSVGQAEDNLKVYLASSSSEDEDEEECCDNSDDETASIASRKVPLEDQIQKYRSLLETIEEKEKKPKEDDYEMEVTWNPGLKASVEEAVKRRQEKTTLTPFEELLKKRKEKKKNKKKMLEPDSSSEENVKGADEAQAFSDDDLPSDVDVNDEFFQEELSKINGPKKREKKKKKSNQDAKPVIEEDEKSKAELELLMMDEDDGKHHFSLKNLLEDNKVLNKKKKKREKMQKTKPEDDFQVNTKDSRFSALYDSHLFNIDPTDPHYKKTKGMEEIIREKQKRRAESSSDHQQQQPKKQKVWDQQEERRTGIQNPSLSSLVKSIKLKTEQLKSRKQLPV